MDDAPESVDASDEPEPNDLRAEVEWLTHQLRSDDPEWKPLADRLAERGIDPQATLLADLWPEDGSLEAGVLVTADGDIFGFEYSWLHTTTDQGTITSWRDLTSSWRIDAYPSESVAVALQILREQGVREVRASRRTDPERLRAHIAHTTKGLRVVGGFRQSLADSLDRRGIDVQRAAWADFYAEREGQTMSYIVTGDGQVFQFNAQLSAENDWHFTAWNDVTNDPMLDVHERELIAVALEIARSDSLPPATTERE